MKTLQFNDLRGHALVSVALFALMQQFSTTLSAATITVSKNSDSGPGSLRQAIQNAAAGDTINFSVSGTIVLTSGELLLAKNLTIAGPGASNLAISGHTNSRVFEISSNVVASISGLTIRDGHAPNGATAGAAGANGGGIYNAGDLTLTGCTVASNAAGAGFSFKSQPVPPNVIVAGGAGGHGGGIYNSGTLKLGSCTLNANTGGGGGRSWNSFAFNNFGGAGGLGGGLYNAGTSSLIDCTLSSNTGGAGGIGGARISWTHVGRPGMPGGKGGSGGGAYNVGALTLIACTFGGNSAGRGGTGGSGGETGADGGAGGNGGAICSATNALTATLRNCLAALNQAGVGGAGGAGSTTAGGPGAAGTGPDLFGPFMSQGHNLVGQADGSAGLTNSVNSDLAGSTAAPLVPNLGLLQNNGGNTLTMALLPGSPALDAGDDTLVDPPLNFATDQRGLLRKSGTHVDIGAFEFQSAPSLTQQLAQIVLPPQLPNQPFHFMIVGSPGATGAIQCSADLIAWNDLANFIIGAQGSSEFADSSVTVPQRFYRLRSP